MNDARFEDKYFGSLIPITSEALKVAMMAILGAIPIVTGQEVTDVT